MEKLALKVAGSVFLIIALAHILRVAMMTHATVNHVYVPQKVSVLAAVVLLALAVWMFKAAVKK